MSKDYYNALWVSKSASDAEIKKAYKKLAMKYHPDRNKDDTQAEKKFKEINEAYQILSDPQKKANYDQFWSADFWWFGWQGNPFWWSQGWQGGWFDFGDIFSQFGWWGRKQRTQDFNFDLWDIFGWSQWASRQQSQYNTPPKRTIDLDITETVTIPFFDFLFDSTLPIKTVYGKNLSLKVKAGTRPGTKFKIKWKGRTSEGKTGDMYVIVDAKMPTMPLDTKVQKMIEAVRYEV